MDNKKLEKFLEGNNQPKFRLGQIQKAIFQDGVASFSEISTISKDLREKMEKEMRMLSFDAEKVLVAKPARNASHSDAGGDGQSIKALLKLTDGNLIETVLISPKPARNASHSDAGGDGQSIKALLKLTDGNLIETVLISPKPARNASHSDAGGPDVWSACISCQVGCAMGCRFCATGKMGFKRNLTAEEITDQILFWRQYLKARSQKLEAAGNISNIVYMGMGEPFLNWDQVSESIKKLTDKKLFGFGSRSISVSTAGISEGIEKMAMEFPQVNLAISLHFAKNEKRNLHMPINKKDNLDSLKNALQTYFKITRRKVFLEYIMLDGINDSADDANMLADYIRSIGNSHLLHVNLIRYNITSESFKPSSKNRTHLFKEELVKRKINSTIRKSLGEEIQGACGQLAAQ